VSSLDKRIYDADQARLVLENPAFSQAFDDIKMELIEQWQNSPARDKVGREHLYQLLRLTNKLELTLRSSLESGQLAKVDLAHKQKISDRLKQIAGW